MARNKLAFDGRDVMEANIERLEKKLRFFKGYSDITWEMMKHDNLQYKKMYWKIYRVFKYTEITDPDFVERVLFHTENIIKEKEERASMLKRLNEDSN